MYRLTTGVIKVLRNPVDFQLIRNFSEENVGATMRNLAKSFNFLKLAPAREQFKEIILRPRLYLENVPHKFIPTVVDGINHWLELPKEKLKSCKTITFNMVDGLFLVDDIEDNAMTRRGVPATHVAHGIPLTLACIAYNFFDVQEEVLKLNHPQAINIYTRFMLDFHIGQGVELFWIQNSECPKMSDYLEIAAMKSSSYMVFSIEFMRLFSKSKEDYSFFNLLLGFFLQVHNDYKNLFMPDEYYDREEPGKFAEDLTEGKFTFPLVHAINTMKNEEVYAILRSKPSDEATKRRCVNILKDIGIQDYCRNILSALNVELHSEIERLGPNPYFKHIVDYYHERMMTNGKVLLKTAVEI